MYYSYQKVKPKQSRSRAILLGVLFLVLIFSAVTYGYFQMNLLRITHAVVAGDETYQKPIEAFFASRTPFFILSAEKVKRDLHQMFPQIYKLAFTTDVIANRVNVSYALREAEFLWCTNDKARICYHVDALGVIFEKSSLVENTFLVRVDDEYFRDVGVGKKIPHAYIEALKQFEQAFLRHDLHLTNFSIKAPFSLVAIFAPGVEVRFSTQKSIPSQIEKLSAFFQSQSKSEVSSLQYIDLRIEDRIYYK